MGYPRRAGFERRDLLKAGLAASGGAMLLGSAAPASASTRTGSAAAPVAGGTVRVLEHAGISPAAGGLYHPNRAPLRPSPFQRLPVGSITPRGWLRGQLDLQRDGLNGRLPEVSDYLVYDKCGWVDPSKVAWEELPYWLRGFGDLGYVTGDERILEQTRTWIEGVLRTQQPDGWFGPADLRTSLEGGPDLWPAMPMVDALRSFHEYYDDDRVIAFLTDFFRFQAGQPAEVFGRGWGSFRWGDNIASAYWLYNRTGDSWLLDLVETMHRGSADYTTGIPTWHNVNLAQGFREPLEYGMLARQPRFREATYRNYETVMHRYGQFPGGGFAGDENCRPGFNDPRQGFETCGIAEFMRSFELLARFTGDPDWTDRCEELAFNSLPAAFDPDQKGIHYITSANSTQLDNQAAHPEFQNRFPMQAYMPGVHQYRCCPHNYGMAWPYYAEELWLATSDGGLCASMYAASEVRAKVGRAAATSPKGNTETAATEITVAEETDYPFDEKVTLRISTPRQVDFPLYLRVPGWCHDAALWVNGERVDITAEPGSYLVVERSWKNGDTVTMRLPMRTSVRTWEDNHDSVSVDRGPLTFSLAIKERWERFDGTQRWPEYEVFADSKWNYGLRVEGRRGRAARSFDIERRSVAPGDNPFTPEGAPIRLHASGHRIPNWQSTEQGVVRFLQDSPVNAQTPEESLTLIPMGAARLRLTALPRIGTPGQQRPYTEWIKPSASHVFTDDLLDALCDGLEPRSSYDQAMPRFTWWDHLGTTEWVQYDYQNEVTASAASVYWYDDTGHGECRVPTSWRLLYWDGGSWRSVPNPSGYGILRDRYNTVSFDRVTTTGWRLEAQLPPGFSSGILEWRID